MRCVDVIRELATPTGELDSALLTEHLSRCISCASWAKRAEQLDRVWDLTRPNEPIAEVWDNLWAQVAHSVDNSREEEGSVSRGPVFRNGQTVASQFEHQMEAQRHPINLPAHGGFRRSIGMVRLARAAAVLIAAGLTLWIAIPSKQNVATFKPGDPDPQALSPSTPKHGVVASLPSVDIEAGHMIVILADPESPSIVSVVDRTPNAMIAGVTREYVDWYGDERSFDWSQVFNEAEFLATPKFAMKE